MSNTLSTEKPTDQPQREQDSRALSLSREAMLGEAMQDAWNNFCQDTGCVPDAFTIHGPRSTRVTAHLIGSSFTFAVLDCLPPEFFSESDQDQPAE